MPVAREADALSLAQIEDQINEYGQGSSWKTFS